MVSANIDVLVAQTAALQASKPPKVADVEDLDEAKDIEMQDVIQSSPIATPMDVSLDVHVGADADVDIDSDSDVDDVYSFPCCDAPWTASDNTTNTVRCLVCEMTFHNGQKGLCSGTKLTRRQASSDTFKYTCMTCRQAIARGH